MTEKLPSLDIGDPWNAICLTARTQGNPLGAMKELVENSIDANAKKIIVERKRGAWRIWDDGDGLPLNEGAPDFEYMITHVFDSIKKKLDEQQRRGTQGEFGIGFLGFWCLAEQAKVVTRGKNSSTRAVVFEKEVRQPEPAKVKERALPGTEVILSELTREGQRLKCDRLAKYLGEVLRGRIEDTGVHLIVRNKAKHKVIDVKPPPFRGERIGDVSKIPTDLGRDVRAELYVAAHKERETVSVAVYRKGTQLLGNIAELEEFDSFPWNANRLDGRIDFNPLNPPPGTREGIVPDKAYEAFVMALKSIEPKIKQRVREYEKAAEEKASREIMQEVQKAFDDAWAELSDEFDWFDSGRGKGPGTKKKRGKGKAKPGVLDAVKISPTVTSVLAGEEKFLTAKALDSRGKPITSVTFSWSVEGNLGAVTSFVNRAAFAAGKEKGEEIVRVIAKQGTIAREATATVLITDTAAKKEPASTGRGLPPYDPVHDPLDGRRSWWDSAMTTMKVNAGHWDYGLQKKVPRHMRLYIARLYAKQLVLLNRQGEPAETILESMLDIVARLEPRLRGPGRP